MILLFIILYNQSFFAGAAAVRADAVGALAAGTVPAGAAVFTAAAGFFSGKAV
jgi:hypothetical protein